MVAPQQQIFQIRSMLSVASAHHHNVSFTLNETERYVHCDASLISSKFQVPAGCFASFGKQTAVRQSRQDFFFVKITHETASTWSFKHTVVWIYVHSVFLASPCRSHTLNCFMCHCTLVFHNTLPNMFILQYWKMSVYLFKRHCSQPLTTVFYYDVYCISSVTQRCTLIPEVWPYYPAYP